MLAKCPACRLTFTGDEAADDPCRRCGTELGTVRRAMAQATQLQQAARQTARDGDMVRARLLAWRAVQLWSTESTRTTFLLLRCAASAETDAGAGTSQQ